MQSKQDERKAAICAEIFAKYGIELSDEDYSEYDRAQLDLERVCAVCEANRLVDCLKTKERYFKPEIKIAGGRVNVEKKRCATWQYALNMRYKRAGLPKKYAGRTFEDYKADADNRDALAMANWYVEEQPKCGLYFYGGAGTGKTFLATLIAKKMIEAGRQVIFGDVPDLLRRIKERFDGSGRFEDGQTAQMIQARYMNCDVLILDDIGAGYMTAWSVGLLYEIINERYNANKRTIVTSNYNLEQLANRLKVKGAELEGERIVSRLTEMCEEGFFGTRDRRREFRRYA